MYDFKNTKVNELLDEVTEISLLPENVQEKMQGAIAWGDGVVDEVNEMPRTVVTSFGIVSYMEEYDRGRAEVRDARLTRV